ncbi:hypothetical protein VZT92_023215 [Zoarces viviparus]
MGARVTYSDHTESPPSSYTSHLPEVSGLSVAVLASSPLYDLAASPFGSYERTAEDDMRYKRSTVLTSNVGHISLKLAQTASELLSSEDTSPFVMN